MIKKTKYYIVEEIYNHQGHTFSPLISWIEHIEYIKYLTPCYYLHSLCSWEVPFWWKTTAYLFDSKKEAKQVVKILQAYDSKATRPPTAKTRYYVISTKTNRKTLIK